ncbi:MAG: peptide ABC transporter substrate-binding protein [Anaerococcus sp.]|uniref:peptide ABC transporter substrate-binding protein n=1 Tax=Anaerococcus sp. TaxID=1872515 RepID=UPI00261AB12E|nr:peptide ABC transporter substrate-binding protein [Anaerococcus sp.]MCI5972048.1 peptide ABC transporter substrate-binding protein [Anaerococcus sp.]MDD6918343.1 peptide ABC transporter substrate-binding protein [Peptoniphilaceae bacterium]MDY2927030.1 peptide ABC transporter substrate-binding protein [Anaerococcus sp.]
MKAKSKLLIGLLSLSMIFSACGGNNDKASDGNDNNQAVVNEEEGKKDGVLDINIASEPDSIDPALNTSVDGAIMISHLFESLIRWDDDGEGNAVLKPGIAESWEVSDDGLTWTFKLRDAKWSDGKDITADDFVYSWNRLVDPATGADYEYMLDMVKGYDEKKLDISAPDPKTFVVNLNVKCPYFEEICAFPAVMPVRKDIIEANKTWTNSPETLVSNGAYKLEKWDHNSTLSMVKNPEYYDQDSVKAEKLAFHLQDDQNAIYASYRSGDLDFINSVPQEEIQKLLDTKELKIKPYVGTYFVCFNTEKEPFNDPKVRKAFSLAIDRNFIVNQVTGQGQEPATAYVPSGVYDAKGAEGDDFRTVGGDYYSINDEDYEKNIEEAKKLMEEAGYKDGEGFPQIDYLYNTDENHKAIAEALQNMWQENLGVQVNLQNQDWNVFLKERKEGNYNIARHGWIADYNDPMSFIDMWLTGGGNNDAQYKNPEFDNYVKAAKATSDPDERMENMHKAEDILIGEDNVVAPLYFYNNSYMMKPNIKGLYYTPLGYFFYKGAEGF